MSHDEDIDARLERLTAATANVGPRADFSSRVMARIGQERHSTLELLRVPGRRFAGGRRGSRDPTAGVRGDSARNLSCSTDAGTAPAEPQAAACRAGLLSTSSDSERTSGKSLPQGAGGPPELSRGCSTPFRDL